MTHRVELWTVSGSYWRLPIRVVWWDEICECRSGSGASLTAKMRALADETLSRSSFKSVGSNYWLKKVELEKIARKFYGEDPEDAIEWLPSRPEKNPVRQDYQPPDPFVMAYCQSPYAIIRDPLIVDAIWVSLCKFMLHWLLNEHQTVNLVFAKLDAFALRKNWASATAKFEWRKMTGRKLERKDFLSTDLENMVNRGVANYLTSPPVTAFDSKHKMLCYTLECSTTDHWRKIVRVIEREKRRTRLGGEYMGGVRDQLRRQLPRVLEAYASYLEETKRPMANVDYVPPSHLDRIEGKRKIVAGLFENLPGIPAWDECHTMFAPVEQDDPEPVLPENAVVPKKVSDLRPKRRHMRKSGRKPLRRPADV